MAGKIRLGSSLATGLWYSLVPRILFAVVAFSCLVAGLSSPPANAAQTVPYKVNFQGRLTGSTGDVVADGSYNIRFRIYSVSTGGSAVWTETRETTNRISVTNGLFSVQLGDVTTLSPSIFTSQPLYLEVELPSTATATCSTASCASWTEGAMTPRSKFGAAPYAMNADTLDGIDATGFIQNSATLQTGNIAMQSAAAGSVGLQVRGATSQTADLLQIQTSTPATVFSIGSTGSALFKNSSNSTTAFRIQNAAGTNIFAVDSSASSVQVGSATNGVAFSANGLVYTGTARPTRLVTLDAEYPGATFTADGSNNTGSLSSDFCSGSSRQNINASACAATITRNYYQWSNTQATAQDYDIYVRYQMPSNYATSSMTNLSLQGWGTTTASESLTLALYSDGSGTACSTSGNAVTANATWGTVTTASPLGACTIVAGDTVTFKIHMVAGQNNAVRAGAISFSYRQIF